MTEYRLPIGGYASVNVAAANLGAAAHTWEEIAAVRYLEARATRMGVRVQLSGRDKLGRAVPVLVAVARAHRVLDRCEPKEPAHVE